MDYWKKLATGISRTGLLGVGLLGLYLGHKQRIPEFMNIISYGVTFIGIYVLTTYLLGNQYEDSEDSDKGPQGFQGSIGEIEAGPSDINPSFERFVPETPKVKRKNTLMKRKYLDNYDKRTEWIFQKFKNQYPNFTDQEFTKFRTILRDIADLDVLPLIEAYDPDSAALHNCSRQLKKISSELKEGKESIEIHSEVLTAGVEQSSTDGSTISEIQRPTNLKHLIDKVKLGDIRQIHTDKNPSASSSHKFEDLDTD